MAHVFNYAILMAVPDRGRGERVNVGMLIFLPSGLDVRITELAKLRSLTGTDWEEYGRKLQRYLHQKFSTGAEALEKIRQAPRVDPTFEASSVAWFSIDSLDFYEDRVKAILTALVSKPRQSAANREKATRINTEIAYQLRKYDVLAKSGEPIENHRVKRNFLIEDNLRADFAQMNGVLRVATTLDLRRNHASLKEAALKAVILDRAGALHSEVHKIGIFASDSPDALDVRSHVNIMKEYSDQTFNWAQEDDRQRLMKYIFSGFRSAGPLI